MKTLTLKDLDAKVARAMAIYGKDGMAVAAIRVEAADIWAADANVKPEGMAK